MCRPWPITSCDRLCATKAAEETAEPARDTEDEVVVPASALVWREPPSSEAPRSVEVATGEARRVSYSSIAFGACRAGVVVARIAWTGAASELNARRIAASPEELDVMEDGAGRAVKLDTFYIRRNCVKCDESDANPDV